MVAYYRYKLRSEFASDVLESTVISGEGLGARDDPLATPSVQVDADSSVDAAPASSPSSTDPFGPALPEPSSPSSGNKVNLVGGILGGIIAVLVVGGIIYFLHSRSRRRGDRDIEEKETTLPLEKVYLPPMPDLTARPFSPDRHTGVVLNTPTLKVDTNVIFIGKPASVPSSAISPKIGRHIQSPSASSTLSPKLPLLPSPAYSPTTPYRHTQSPSTSSNKSSASRTTSSSLPTEPDAPSSSFLDLSSTPATSSFLSDTDSRIELPPIFFMPSPHIRSDLDEGAGESSTKPLNLKSKRNPQPTAQDRKAKATPKKHCHLSRVLHIKPRDHREQEDAPPPAYTEPNWSFWDGESPPRTRFGR